VSYHSVVPKLWSETIEAHRREVGDAILDATASLVAQHGLRAVTMSQIAETTGIGRATLYKYYPDVEAILARWHERHVAGHLAELSQLRDQSGTPIARLRAALERYATIQYERDRGELGALLHRGEHIDRAGKHLRDLFRGLLAEAAKTGDVRRDIPPLELTDYCLTALSAAAEMPTHTAAVRLVKLVLAGLAPERAGSKRVTSRAR
jgi:AcrR family transcriptional regulator